MLQVLYRAHSDILRLAELTWPEEGGVFGAFWVD